MGALALWILARATRLVRESHPTYTRVVHIPPLPIPFIHVRVWARVGAISSIVGGIGCLAGWRATRNAWQRVCETVVVAVVVGSWGRGEPIVHYLNPHSFP